MATMVNFDSVLRDMFPPPGEEPAPWVAEYRRALREAREASGLVEVPPHEDNTGLPCRNVGSAWKYDCATHDCCEVCNDIGEVP